MDYHKRYYTLFDPSMLHDLVGNTITMDNLCLFDSLDDQDQYRPPIDFANTLLKLNSELIIICVEGRITYNLEGDKTINLTTGNVVFLKEGQIVEFLEADNDCRLILLAFPQDIGIRDFNHWDMFSESVVLTPAEETMKELIQLYQMMKRKISDSLFTQREEIVNSLMNVIMLHLYDILIKKEEGNRHITMSSLYNRRLSLYNRFIKEVKRNFNMHRDVKYYARILSLSPGHLSRIVKSVSGKTASEWIKDYVILEAKVMLKSKKLAVFEISDYLNFANPSFFSKYFREREGTTPSQYRLLANETEQ